MSNFAVVVWTAGGFAVYVYGSFQVFTHSLTLKDPIVGGGVGKGGLSRNAGRRSVSRSKAGYSEDRDLCPGRRGAMVLVSSHPPGAPRSQRGR